MTKQLTDLTQMFVQTVERLTNETEKRKDTRMSKESSDSDGSKRSKDNGHRNEKVIGRDGDDGRKTESSDSDEKRKGKVGSWLEQSKANVDIERTENRRDKRHDDGEEEKASCCGRNEQ